MSTVTDPPRRVQRPQVFLIPLFVITSGIWTKLQQAAKALYVVLARYVNHERRKQTGEWIAWPDVERLAEILGVSERHCYRLLKELESFGLIRRRPANDGPGKAYEFLFPDNSVTSGMTPTTPDGCHGSQAAPDSHVTPLTGEPTKKEQEVAAAADDEGLQNRLAALAAAGIGEPKRSELAGLRGLTNELINRVVDRCTAKGKSIGALIRELEAQAEAALARDSRRQAEAEAETRKEEEAQRKRQEEAKEQAARQQERDAASEFFDQLDPGVRERAVDEVFNAMPPGQRSLYKRRDSIFIKVKVYKMLTRNRGTPDDTNSQSENNQHE